MPASLQARTLGSARRACAGETGSRAPPGRDFAFARRCKLEIFELVRSSVPANVLKLAFDPDLPVEVWVPPPVELARKVAALDDPHTKQDNAVGGGRFCPRLPSCNRCRSFSPGGFIDMSCNGMRQHASAWYVHGLNLVMDASRRIEVCAEVRHSRVRVWSSRGESKTRCTPAGGSLPHIVSGSKETVPVLASTRMAPCAWMWETQGPAAATTAAGLGVHGRSKLAPCESSFARGPLCPPESHCKNSRPGPTLLPPSVAFPWFRNVLQT
ncbi:unnamed protein product [Symbiodinium sp. CCMP2456]|nr:unnamed protein product [Symbiodinium sp. CCMP2456]